MTSTRPSPREAVLAASVAVVVADSSVVTLGLPDILREFDATVGGAASVLVVFNVVLAAGLVPAAVLAERAGPGRVWAGGVVLLALASLACAVAGSMTPLLAGRVAQALGGAAVLAGAVAHLGARRGSEAEGARIWGPAGVAGLALGPAIGGLLTELLSWQAIFALQVPVVALVLAAPRGRVAPPGDGARLRAAPAVALALMSSASTAALFLLVILLTRGWEYSPLQAAAIVSVMAVVTVAAGALAGRLEPTRWTAAAGVVAASAGLAALGLLPGAGWGWTLLPQVLVGTGLGLALPALTDQALARDGLRGGRAAVGTLWVRHAGVVAGLAILVPLFDADLRIQQRAAERSGTALLLEAPLPPSTKIALAEALARQLRRADGRLPQLAPAFAAVPAPEGAEAEHRALRAALQDELSRAATEAFSRSFLVAGLLGLLTLLPLAAAGGRPRRPDAAFALCALASGAVLGGHLAAGGGSYEPLAVRDPCAPRPAEGLRGGGALLEQLGLSALDGAACELRVTREELVAALATEQSREAFARAHHIGEDRLEAAVRAGLERAVADAARTGRISGLQLTLLREAVERLPVGLLLELLDSGPGRDVLGLLEDLIRRGGP